MTAPATPATPSCMACATCRHRDAAACMTCRTCPHPSHAASSDRAGGLRYLAETTALGPVPRRTSQYVIAFTAVEGWTLDDTLTELIVVATERGWVVAGSHVKDGLASLVLRFPNHHAAVSAAFDLSAEVHAPLAGIVTGLGVHRREVTL